jgi:hypothetical protein
MGCEQLGLGLRVRNNSYKPEAWNKFTFLDYPNRADGHEKNKKYKIS